MISFVMIITKHIAGQTSTYAYYWSISKFIIIAKSKDIFEKFCLHVLGQCATGVISQR